MINTDKICSIKDCDRNAYAKGMCQRHYLRMYLYEVLKREYKDNGKICLAEDCGKPMFSKELCEMHYLQLIKTVTPKQELPIKKRIKHQLIGKRFGKLVVLSKGKTRRYPGLTQIMYLCKCDCGATKEILGNSLINGDSKSCGCSQLEQKIKGAKYGSVAKGRVMKDYLNGAKERGLPFLLSTERFFELTQQPCYYCGAPPMSIMKSWSKNALSKPYAYNGIDRVDNELGYMEENCVSCCKICNYAKKNLSLEEFKVWVSRLVSHFDTWKDKDK